MLLLYNHLQDKYSVIIHPKDSASELGPNGMSCFIVKINSALNMDISGEQKSGFGCLPNLDGLMDIKKIIPDFCL